MRKIYLIAFLSILSAALPAQTNWSSKFVKKQKDGSLVYIEDAKGNILPDFSKVGYGNGSKIVPWHSVKYTLSASGQNDQQKIQAVIDKLSAGPADKDGHRGVILLKKGTYNIPGTLKIAAGGIVLRGEGNETRLIATGKGQRKLIAVNGTGSRTELPGTRRKITSPLVKVGAKWLHLSSTEGFKKGDRIIIFRPGTARWIADLKMDQIMPGEGTVQWKPEDYNLEFERVITSINENTVYLDHPVVMEMAAGYGGGEVYKYSFDGRISEVGIEDLYCASEYASETDEDHGWEAVYFNRVENGWIRNVTSRYFGFSCVNLGNFARNITVANCNALQPKSQVTGGRRYSFNNDGQLNLFRDCYASEGRHDYATGARVLGPNVFFNSTAENARSDIGPHHRWAVGTLYDNIVTDGDIDVQDRGNWGTGHGWAGVNQILWNCVAARAAVQDPYVSGHNYNIGFKGEKYGGRLPERPDGIWEGQNSPGLEPRSLYLAQVAAATPFYLSAVKKLPAEILKAEILKSAAWALKEQPITVTASRATRSAGGKHDFYSEGDYWWPDSTGKDKPYVQRDGMTNPDNFVAHREAMIRFSRIVGALASAYKLTGDSKYLLHALKHCKAWFLDEATRMNPSLLYAQAIKGRVTGRGIGIIDTIQLMEVVQGLMAMQYAPQMDLGVYKGIQDWFSMYLTWLTTHPYGKEEMEAKNNHGTCWVMQVAVFAKFTGNRELIRFCTERYKNTLLPEQMAADGSFPLEIKRTKPYGYSIFNLDAMATICQTLSTSANDLWSFVTPDGKTLLKGVEFLYPYLKDKEKWPYGKDVMYWEQWPVAQPALLFAGLRMNQSDWLKTWIRLEHTPGENEVIRNLPVRNPVIWIN